MSAQIEQPPRGHQPVPDGALRIYHMIWQLESWLRMIVYVELRSKRSDWEAPLGGVQWPPSSLINDKRQHHMCTPHVNGISYLSFGELWTVISSDNNWPLFAPYFPPKANAVARIDEVKAIRNRIAHFRDPHPQDENRLALFLRDMEPGVKRFCVRYRSANRVKSDPASTALEESWEQIGYGIEMLLPTGRWLYAPEPYRDHPVVGASLDILMRKDEPYTPGSIYRLTIYAQRTRQIDFVSLFENTKALHKNIIHMFLSPPDQVAVTISESLGVESIVELLAGFLSVGLECTRCNSYRVLESYRAEVPEYVIWPEHLLSFFDEDIRDSLLVSP
jgi:hypothetical protein